MTAEITLLVVPSFAMSELIDYIPSFHRNQNITHDTDDILKFLLHILIPSKVGCGKAIYVERIKLESVILSHSQSKAGPHVRLTHHSV